VDRVQSLVSISIHFWLWKPLAKGIWFLGPIYHEILEHQVLSRRLEPYFFPTSLEQMNMKLNYLMFSKTPFRIHARDIQYTGMASNTNLTSTSQPPLESHRLHHVLSFFSILAINHFQSPLWYRFAFKWNPRYIFLSSFANTWKGKTQEYKHFSFSEMPHLVNVKFNSFFIVEDIDDLCKVFNHPSCSFTNY